MYASIVCPQLKKSQEDHVRMLLNCSHAAIYVGLASLIGYYNFGVNSWIGVATNACFFFLGFLMISTWRRPEHVCPECPEIEIVTKVREEIIEEIPAEEEDQQLNED